MKKPGTLLGSASMFIVASLFSMQSMADQPQEAACRPILNEITQIENQIGSIDNQQEAYDNRLDSIENQREAVENSLQNATPKEDIRRYRRAQSQLAQLARDERELRVEKISLELEKKLLLTEVQYLEGRYSKCMVVTKPGI